MSGIAQLEVILWFWHTIRSSMQISCGRLCLTLLVGLVAEPDQRHACTYHNVQAVSIPQHQNSQELVPDTRLTRKCSWKDPHKQSSSCAYILEYHASDTTCTLACIRTSLHETTETTSCLEDRCALWTFPNHQVRICMLNRWLVQCPKQHPSHRS